MLRSINQTLPLNLDEGKARNLARGQSEKGQGKPSAQFETILLHKVVEAMRSTVSESGMLSDGPGSQMYDYMIVQALSQTLNSGGGLGLARHFSEIDDKNASEIQKIDIPAIRRAPETNETQAGLSTLDALTLSASEMQKNNGLSLADELPPTTDHWLNKPNAEETLREILSGGENE